MAILSSHHLSAVQPKVLADLARHVPLDRHPHLIHHASPLALAENDDVDLGFGVGCRDAVQRRLHRADVVLVGQAPVVEGIENASAKGLQI